LLDIVKQSLIFAFNSADVARKQDSEHSYQELVADIERMSIQDPFIEDVFEIYFGTSWKEITKEISGTKKRGKTMNMTEAKKLVSNSRGAGGLVFEKIEELVLNTLDVNVKHTGKTLQKADLIILETTVTLPDMGEVDEKTKSKRAHFIEKYKQFYKNLTDTAGSIVEINAKNYNLATPEFKEKGFTAQGATSIDNFESMLRAYNYDKDRTDRLIFALTNIGPDTLSQDYNLVSRNIALLVAYFLFDDIDLDEGLNFNAVHVLNLDGLYIPLSCFLYAAYDTLKDFNGLSDDMVKVMYQPDSVNY
jgi:hypothetical protein